MSVQFEVVFFTMKKKKVEAMIDVFLQEASHFGLEKTKRPKD